jgi:acyl-CoA synthetase (AMP-forming)/AMP-acid ligase II
MSSSTILPIEQLQGWQRFAPTSSRPSFADHFHHLVIQEPNKVILNFINDVGRLTHELSTSMLDASAQMISKFLIEKYDVKVGDRVILLCDPGVDFVIAFFGVLYAGAIAVPCYPPMNEKQFLKLFKIGKNCGAKTVMLSGEFYKMIKDTIPEIEKEMSLEDDQKLQWVSLSDVPLLDKTISKNPDMDLVYKTVSEFVRPEVKANDVAFLQYSSGSTGDPKGVSVTHLNIITHTSTITRTFEYDPSDKDVTVTVSILTLLTFIYSLFSSSGYHLIMTWG